MIVASSLIAPKGPIALVMFPGLDSKVLETLVSERLEAAYDDERVTDAADNATKDKMARLLAIHTTLIEDVYPRMLAEPNSVTTTEKGGSAYTDKQRSDFLAWANGYLDQFTDLLPVAQQGEWGSGCAHRAS